MSEHGSPEYVPINVQVLSICFFLRLHYTPPLQKGPRIPSQEIIPPYHYLSSQTKLSKMSIEISQITDEDIPSAVECIQEAFKDDPYNNWASKLHLSSHTSPFLFSPHPNTLPGLPPPLLLLQIPKHPLPNPPLQMGSKTRPIPRGKRLRQPLPSPRRSLLAPSQSSQRTSNLDILLRRLVVMVRTSKSQYSPHHHHHFQTPLPSPILKKKRQFIPVKSHTIALSTSKKNFAPAQKAIT